MQSHPPHLLSGNLNCGLCGGSLSLVSGKGKGYYGCLNASRKSCENKMLISRKKLEKHFMNALYEKALTPDVLGSVYDKVAEKVKEQFIIAKEYELHFWEMSYTKETWLSHREDAKLL